MTIPPSTIDTLTMRTSADAIFQAAAAVERWPAFLPHYRLVQVLAELHEGRVVDMAVRHGCIPVRWTALQVLHPEQRRIDYQHLHGPTRGMADTWMLVPGINDVLVTITHDLTLREPLFDLTPVSWFIGSRFVSPITQQTLTGLKRYLEDICVVS